ncbi:MAG: carbon-nitrogen hydrolase [Desulfuromonadales bacterium]
MRQIKLGLVQQNCRSERDKNIERSIAGIRDAARLGARLIVLQELHSGPYFCKSEDPAFFDQAETIPGPSTEIFGEIAGELKVVLVISLFEKRAPGLYHNTAVVLDSDGQIAGMYRKMHIPDDPGYHEKFYFTPGDTGFEPIDTSIGRLGLLVCWDQWYPEAARLMALAGAELLIYPTAIGWDPNDPAEEQQRQRDAWETVQRGHAIANGLPLLSVNRVGLEKDPDGRHDALFWGSSFVAGPQGEILGRGSSEVEEVLVAEIDLDRSEQVRRIWPFLRDRRIDAYDDLRRCFRD